MPTTDESPFGRPDADWPRREASRRVDTSDLSWHVQVSGEGPVAVLLHGTGSSSHTWAWIAPLLDASFRLVAPDVPGHGFTAPRPPARMNSRAIAEDVDALLAALGVEPALVVGHSAGAAVALRLASRRPSIRGVVGLAPSLADPWPGAPASVRRLTRVVGASRSAAGVAAAIARAGGTSWVLRSARSDVPEASSTLYRRLASRPGHAAAALAMMSHWDAAEVEALVPTVTIPCRFVAGGNDPWIRPALVRAAAERCPGAVLSVLDGGGHLLHEESPGRAAAEIESAARECGVIP